MQNRATNWHKNILVFKLDSVLQWFLIPIGVWVLIWTHYLNWTQVGIITAVSLFISILLELPTGALADLIGRKKTILIGRILGVIGFAIFAVGHNFWMFLIADILYHANWAFESGALSALLYDSLKENNQEKEFYQKTESDTFFWCTIGMAIASVLGGYLYRLHPHAPYLATTIVSFGALMGAFFFEEPLLDSKKFSLKTYLIQNIEGVKHIFRNPIIRAISVFSVLISFTGYVGLWYLYEPRLAEGQFPANLLGILVAGTYLIRAIGTKFIPLTLVRIKHQNIPIFLTILQMFGSGLSFIENKFGAISSVYSRKFADGFRVPILLAIQNEKIESMYRATSLSAISLFYNLLVALVGPVIGMMMDRYHASFTMGIFFFIGLFLVLPTAISLRRQLRRN